jgi:hypothetical protein
MTADTIQPPSVLLVEETFTPAPGDRSLAVFMTYQRTAAAMPQTSHHETGRNDIICARPPLGAPDRLPCSRRAWALLLFGAEL